jgi:hypothetical protein
MSDAYDKIDRYLRNNLNDTDYAEYSDALEEVYSSWCPEKDTAWIAMLGRRVPVENILRECAIGKRPRLTPDQCRDLAMRLGSADYQINAALWPDG